MTSSMIQKRRDLVNVQIRVDETITEPYAVLYTPELNEQINEMEKLIRGHGKEEFLLLEQEERYHILKPQDIYMARFEEQQVTLYGEKEKYRSRQRLYEVEEGLGSGFMRISKTTIINLKQIDSVEPSFRGTMILKLKNGQKDYISRKYLPEFKRYIGL